LAELQAVTAGLSQARTPDQVGEVIVERATAGSGAASGALCLLSDDGRTMEVARSAGYDEAAIARFRTFPLASDLPAADALRTRRIVLMGSIAERDRLYPELADVPARNNAFAIVPVFAGDDPVGAIALGWADARAFSEDDVRFLDAIGQQAGQALDRARFYAAEHESAVRQGFLAEASRVLSSSLDYEETLARVARLAVPGIADSCTVHLVDDAGLRLVVTAHVDPDSEAILRERAVSGRPSTNPLLLGILESGEPVLLPALSDTSWEHLAQDPAELDVLRRLGVRSALAVPLVTRDRRIGVLSLTMGRSDRHYRQADLPFIEDLASRPCRRRLRTWLESALGDPQTAGSGAVDDVLLVAGELCTNAIQWARAAVELRAWAGPGCTVEVTDDGPGFEGSLPPAESAPDPTSERGRGLFLVRSLRHDCRVQSGGHGTLVRCTMPV